MIAVKHILAAVVSVACVALPAFITPEENAETAETTTVAAAPMGKTEIVAALEKISQKDAAEITREEVNRLKVQFFSSMLLLLNWLGV